jgi:hypothetical protein
MTRLFFPVQLDEPVTYGWLPSIITGTWEAEIRRITIQNEPRQIVHETPISKITREKWTGGMVQVVEHLLCKCKALSSNPTPAKNKKVE